MRRLLALMIVLLFVASGAAIGCGGDDDNNSTIPTDNNPPDNNPPDNNPPDNNPPADDIIAVATGAGNFMTLLAAVDAAGLTDTLMGPGPFTVFAPTDDAFADLGQETIDALLAEPMGDLRTILLYHVVSGAAIGSADVSTGFVNTAADLEIFVKVDSGTVMYGDATVTTADVEASNGIIHVIDQVVTPYDQNIVEIAAGNDDFSTLVDLVIAADLAGALSADGPFTVFAPPNSAFAALDADLLAFLTDEANVDILTKVLGHHVVSGRITSNLVAAGTVTTLAGTEVEISLNGGVSYGGAQVTATDIIGTNGVIHVLGSVAVPADNQFNIVEFARLQGLTELVGAVLAAADLPDGTSVAEALSGAGPLTVFAPSNAAFQAIAQTVAGLSAEGLRDVLLYHVVDGAVFSGDLMNGNVPTLLAGSEVTIDTAGPTVNGANIGPADLEVSNGVIHVIDAVLLP